MDEYRSIHKDCVSFMGEKAKLKWCTDGDENSALLHQSIRATRLKNTVYAINDKYGNWEENIAAVNEAFLDY